MPIRPWCSRNVDVMWLLAPDIKTIAEAYPDSPSKSHPEVALLH